MQGTLPDLSKIVPALVDHGDELADKAAEITRQYAPVSKEDHADRAAGTFRDSITGRSESTGEGVALKVSSDDELAEIILKGSSAHEIVAHGRALAFEWNGTQVFFRRVHHPGTAPHDVGGDAIDDVLYALTPMLQDIVQQALTQ